MLISYEADKAELINETVWQHLVAANINFDPETIMQLDLRAWNRSGNYSRQMPFGIKIGKGPRACGNSMKKETVSQAVHIYSTYYKRYSAGVRVKQIRKDAFKRWKYLAIAKQDECSERKISVEEYIDWMESSFPNRPRKKD